MKNSVGVRLSSTDFYPIWKPADRKIKKVVISLPHIKSSFESENSDFPEEREVSFYRSLNEEQSRLSLVKTFKFSKAFDKCEIYIGEEEKGFLLIYLKTDSGEEQKEEIKISDLSLHSDWYRDPEWVKFSQKTLLTKEDYSPSDLADDESDSFDLLGQNEWNENFFLTPSKEEEFQIMRDLQKESTQGDSFDALKDLGEYDFNLLDDFTSQDQEKTEPIDLPLDEFSFEEFLSSLEKEDLFISSQEKMPVEELSLLNDNGESGKDPFKEEIIRDLLSGSSSSEEEEKEVEALSSEEEEKEVEALSSEEEEKEVEALSSEEEEKEVEALSSEEEEKEVEALSSEEEEKEVEALSSEEEEKEVEALSSEEEEKEVEALSSEEEEKEVEALSSEEEEKEVEALSSEEEEKEVEALSSEEEEKEVEALSSEEEEKEVEALSSEEEEKEVEALSSEEEEKEVEALSSEEEEKEVEALSSEEEEKEVEALSSEEEEKEVEALSSEEEEKEVEALSSEEEEKEVEALSSEEEEKEVEALSSEEEEKEVEALSSEEEEKEVEALSSEEEEKEVEALSSEEEEKEVEALSSEEEEKEVEALSSEEEEKEVEALSSEEEEKEVEALSSEEEEKEVEALSSEEEEKEVEALSSEEEEKEVEALSSEEEEKEVEALSSEEEEKEVEALSSEEEEKEVEALSSEEEEKEVEALSSEEEEKEVEALSSEEDLGISALDYPEEDDTFLKKEDEDLDLPWLKTDQKSENKSEFLNLADEDLSFLGKIENDNLSWLDNIKDTENPLGFSYDLGSEEWDFGLEDKFKREEDQDFSDTFRFLDEENLKNISTEELEKDTKAALRETVRGYHDAPIIPKEEETSEKEKQVIKPYQMIGTFTSFALFTFIIGTALFYKEMSGLRLPSLEVEATKEKIEIFKDSKFKKNSESWPKMSDFVFDKQ